MDNRMIMRRALGDTGLYDTDSKYIDAELKSYEAGFTEFYEECERVLGNCFIETADEDNILKRVGLFRRITDAEDREELRNQLSEKAKIRGCRLADTEERLKAAGIDGNVGESLNTVTISGELSLIAEEEIKKYLPVGIGIEIIIG